MQKDGSKGQIDCPEVVKDYNMQMGGVDKANMMFAIYCVGRKSKKWWHRILFGHLDFRCNVAQALITLSRSGSKRRSASISPLWWKRNLLLVILFKNTPLVSWQWLLLVG